LERAGFPKNVLLGGWSRAGIEQWFAKRAGIVAQSSDDQERERMREAIKTRARTGGIGPIAHSGAEEGGSGGKTPGSRGKGRRAGAKEPRR
jgi:hypothetical protein